MTKLRKSLNMEIIYVPVASVSQVREMMFNWNMNNKKIKNWCFVSFLTSFLPLIFFSLEVNASNANKWVSMAATAMFLISGLLINRNQKYFYYLPFISLIVAIYPLSNIDNVSDLITKIVCFAVIFIPSTAALFYCYKALYNYKDVLAALKKRKGYPNFVFNTADKYGEKIYLKNKKQETADLRVEAAYNPFNTEENKHEEEIRRMDNLHYKGFAVKEYDIEKGEYYEAKEVKHKETTYKYGITIGNFDIIIPHNEIKGESKEEKRRLIRLWNELTQRTLNNELVVIFFMLSMSLAALVKYGINGVFCLVIALMYFFGSSCVRLNEWWGCIVMLVSPALYCVAFPEDFSKVGAAFFYVLFAPKHIIWLMNYPILNKLKKERGYPSFIETKHEKYGDDYYIVEKDDNLPKLKANKPIIVNIGYDEVKSDINSNKAENKAPAKTEKTKDGGWNAFTYLDKDPDNSAYDDFDYMEHMQKVKMNAKANEEKPVPNLKTGATTIGEMNENKNN